MEMKLKELENYMYATALVKIYDSLDGFDCCVVYRGCATYIPDNYLHRKIRAIDSEVDYIDIILEYED